MRSSKRVLAGVAAGALGAGLLIGLGTTSAQAAVITTGLQAQANTAVVRTPLATAATANIPIINGTTAGANTYTVTVQKFARNGVQVGADSLIPAGISIINVNANAGAVGNVITATGAIANNAKWADVQVTGNLAPGTWTFQAAWAGGGDTQTATYTFYVSGAPAVASWGSTSYTAAAGGAAATTAVGLRDASGLPTYLVTGESVTVSAGTAVITAVPSLYDAASLGQTQVNGAIADAGRVAGALSADSTGSGNYTVNVAAASGLATFTTTPVTLVVTPAVAAGTRGIAPNQSLYDAGANTLYVSTAQKSVTFTASAAALNNTYGFAVSAVSGQPLPAGVTPGFTAVAGTNNLPVSGSSLATFTVTATNPLPGQQYSLLVSGSVGAYTVIYQAPVAYNLSAPATIAVATGTTANLVAEVTDQFGDAFAGGIVTWSATGRNTVPASTAVSTAAGEVVLAVPDTSTSTTNLTATVSASVPAITLPATAPTQVRTSTTTLAYATSIAVGSITPVGNLTNGTTGYSAAATTSGTGTVNVQTTVASSTSTVGQVKIVATVKNTGGAVMPGIPVTISGGEGTYFVNNGTDAAAPVLGEFGARTSAVQYTNSSGQVTFQARPTKTGTATITMAAGDKSATYQVTVQNAPTDARVLTVTPATADVTSNRSAQITGTVVDGFGNPVPNATVSFSEVGPATFGNGASTISGTTASNGALTVALNNNEGAGTSDISVAVTTSGTQVTALANVAIIGFPAGKGTGASKVVWTGGADRSITIAGARGTVSGKPGVIIDGVTTGIENGKTVKPFFRFPGQTTFTEGSARPVITNGTFEWQRKTGKKFYAYVTSDDGQVQSNRVIIAAN